MAIFWSNFWRWLLHVFAVVVVACSRQSVRREGWVVPSASLRTNLQGRQGSSAKAATGGADSDLAGKKNLLGRCWKTSWEKDNLHRHQAVQSFLQPRYIVSLLSYFHKDHSMSQHQIGQTFWSFELSDVANHWSSSRELECGQVIK